MGVMVDGGWRPGGVGTDEKGAFKRAESVFRDWVTADGSSGFEAEPGRYHLYVSLACPWAHRTLILRSLKKLTEAISLSVVDHFMGENGWEFTARPGCIPDTVNGARYLHEVYRKAKPDYTGRVTVPALWDKQRATIVNNESSEIIRMFNAAFDADGDASVDFYPAALRREIDAERDGAEAYGPDSVVAFRETDRLAGQGLADVDAAPAPLDLAARAHPAHGVIVRVVGRLEAAAPAPG